MGLHGGLADEELLPDLGIGEAGRDQAQDLELARRQLVERRRRVGAGDARELLDHAFRDSGGEEGVAGGDGADRGEQLLGWLVLEDEPAGTGPQRLVDVFVEIERRQDEDPRRAVGREDAPRCLEPVELRHADVHQDHARVEPGRLLHRLEAGARLRHDLDVLLAGEQHPEARRAPSTGRRRRGRGSSCRVAAEGEARAEDEAAAGCRPGAHLAAVDLDPLADADETVAVARRSPIARVRRRAPRAEARRSRSARSRRRGRRARA